MGLALSFSEFQKCVPVETITDAVDEVVLKVKEIVTSMICGERKLIPALHRG